MKNYLKRQLAHLDTIGEYDVTTGSELREMVSEIEIRAASQGLPDVVRACQIRQGPIGIGLCRRILAACLAGCGVPTGGPLTVRQAAMYLNVSPKTIYHACESGTLRHLRIGEGRGTIRINRDALENFKRQNQIVPIRDYLS